MKSNWILWGLWGMWGCGLWAVAQSPQKEGFLEMSTLAMIHFSSQTLPLGLARVCLVIFLFFAINVFLLFSEMPSLLCLLRLSWLGLWILGSGALL